MSNVIAAGGGGAGGTASATSNEISVLVQTASAAATSADAHAAIASAAATSVDGRVTLAAAALAAAVDVVSNAVSNELSVRAVSVQTASAAATSADARAAAASAAATSVLTYVCAASARTTAGTSVKGVQSVVDALSGRISAIVAGAASVTSAEHNTLSQAVSVLQEMDRRRVVGDAQTIAAGLTNISGLCVAVSTGGTFKLDAMLLVDRSAAMSGPTRFGLTFPTMTKTRGEIRVPTTVVFSALDTQLAVAVWDGNSASGSTLLCLSVSVSPTNMLVTYKGIFVVASDGNIVLQAGASATITTGIAIQQGSYMHVFRMA